MIRFILFFSLVINSNLLAKDYVIFSVEHSLPMGEIKNENLQKNFFVNVGKIQGVTKGSKLSVLRRVLKKSSLENNKEYQTLVPLGTIEVIHSDEYSSIGIADEKFRNQDIAISPNTFMVGDLVEPK